MTRDEIKKKWKNGQFVESKQQAEKNKNKKVDKESLPKGKGMTTNLVRNVMKGKEINPREPEQLPKSQNQEEKKYGRGNIDLTNRPVVRNNDGSISTVRSMSFRDDKENKEILVPTVVNGKVVSDDEAIKHYYQTGEYLGKFDTVDEANNYAERLHEQQEAMYSKKSTWQNVADRVSTMNQNRGVVTGNYREEKKKANQQTIPIQNVNESTDLGASKKDIKKAQKRMKFLNSNNFLEYEGKELKTGVSGGVRGMAEAGLTEQANTLDQRKDESIGTTFKKIIQNAWQSQHAMTDPVERQKTAWRVGANILKNSSLDIAKQIQSGDYQKSGTLGKFATTLGSVYVNTTNALKKENAGVKVFEDASVLGGTIKEKLTGKSKAEQSKEALEEAKKIYKPIQEANEDLQLVGKQYGAVGETIGSATQSLGNMLPSAGVAFVSGNPDLRTSSNGGRRKG